VSVTESVVTVKGSPIRSLQKFIDAELTPDQKERALQKLPAEYASRLRVPIIVTETIPVAIVNRLTEEAANVKGEPLERFARRAGRAGASEAIQGIYRFFALVLTPAALLSKAAHMWRNLYSRGELKVESQTDSSAVLRLSDFPSEPAGCGRISGWIERLAEMTGAKEPRVTHTKCASKGAPYCEWDVKWGK
jgi:hypothetical protein